MHANPHPSDDLSELERRLSSWQPTVEGLDADAMLFAAGRASGRPKAARFLWPTLACVMTGLALFLGACLQTERHERLALLARIQQQRPAPPSEPGPSPSTAVQALPAQELPPTSLLAAHQALEHGLDSWPAPTRTLTPSGSPRPSGPVFQVGRLDLVLGP